MSSYWSRAREWARQSTKTYNLTKAIPPIVAAVLQFWLFDLRPMIQTLIIVVTIVGGYLLLYWIEFTWNILFRAPVALDAERATEIAQGEARAAEARDIVSKELLARQKQIAELQVALTEKHPHDQHLKSRIVAALDLLDERSLDFIRWLLDSGRVNRGRIQNQGFGGMQDGLNQRAGIDLITHEPIRSANGTEFDREHQINPRLVAALKHVLYPPPRPVTPPQG